MPTIEITEYEKATKDDDDICDGHQNGGHGGLKNHQRVLGCAGGNSVILVYYVIRDSVFCTMFTARNAVPRGASSRSFKRFASTKVSMFSPIIVLLLIQV